jgi:uncharacterized protein YndB with AHSA1/START domain
MGDTTTVQPGASSLRRTIRMTRRLDAPPERVSRAWTDPEELARWLPDRVEGALAVGARTELVWPDRRLWWEVTEVVTGRRFAFRRGWLPDLSLITSVTVSFTPSGYGTWLRLEDGPFPLDLPGGLDAWADAIQTWSEALVMLRAHLDFSVDVRPKR